MLLDGFCSPPRTNATTGVLPTPKAKIGKNDENPNFRIETHPKRCFQASPMARVLRLSRLSGSTLLDSGVILGLRESAGLGGSPIHHFSGRRVLVAHPVKRLVRPGELRSVPRPGERAGQPDGRPGPPPRASAAESQRTVPHRRAPPVREKGGARERTLSVGGARRYSRRAPVDERPAAPEAAAPSPRFVKTQAARGDYLFARATVVPPGGADAES